MDPNTLNLDPDPEYCPNLDPVPDPEKELVLKLDHYFCRLSKVSCVSLQFFFFRFKILNVWQLIIS